MEAERSVSIAGVDTTGPRRAFTCQCFSLCSAEDAASLRLRLPRALPGCSPWRTYLDRVYGVLPNESLYDVQALELFYLMLLPARRCTDTAEMRACPPAQCNSWLSPAAPDDEAVRDLLINRTFLRTSDWVLLSEPLSRRRPFSSHSWVEVTRRSAERLVSRRSGARLFPEGAHGYGCWFLPARGSGVFVEVGRSLIVRRRLRGRAGCSSRPRFPEDYANVTRARGYDSLQILLGNPLPLRCPDCASRMSSRTPSFELVLAVPACMEGAEPLRAGCLQRGLTRSGWRASAPCECDESPPHGDGLNCARVAGWLAHISFKWAACGAGCMQCGRRPPRELRLTLAGT